MIEVQALTKPWETRKCSELAQTFNECILQKYSDWDELRLIFDRYNVEFFETGHGGRKTRRTSIDYLSHYNLSMKKLLFHPRTKHELTIYWGEKLLTAAAENRWNVVMANGSQCQGTHKDMSFHDSNQEEADTKLLLHALDATASGEATLQINSLDITRSMSRYCTRNMNGTKP